MILGSVRIEFNGGAPLASSRDVQVQEDGSLTQVALVPFLWDLVAACSRLIRGLSGKETISMIPTTYALVVETSDDQATVRLMATKEHRLNQVAAVSLTLREFVNAFIPLAYLVSRWITDTNPELKGNLHLQRFIAAISKLQQEVGKLATETPGNK